MIEWIAIGLALLAWFVPTPTWLYQRARRKWEFLKLKRKFRRAARNYVARPEVTS